MLTRLIGWLVHGCLMISHIIIPNLSYMLEHHCALSLFEKNVCVAVWKELLAGVVWIYSYLRPLQDKETLSTPLCDVSTRPYRHRFLKGGGVESDRLRTVWYRRLWDSFRLRYILDWNLNLTSCQSRRYMRIRFIWFFVDVNSPSLIWLFMMH